MSGKTLRQQTVTSETGIAARAWLTAALTALMLITGFIAVCILNRSNTLAEVIEFGASILLALICSLWIKDNAIELSIIRVIRHSISAKVGIGLVLIGSLTLWSHVFITEDIWLWKLEEIQKSASTPLSLSLLNYLGDPHPFLFELTEFKALRQAIDLEEKGNAIFNHDGDRTDARRLWTAAEELYKQANDTQGQVYVLKSLATSYWDEAPNDTTALKKVLRFILTAQFINDKDNLLSPQDKLRTIHDTGILKDKLFSSTSNDFRILYDTVILVENYSEQIQEKSYGVDACPKELTASLDSNAAPIIMLVFSVESLTNLKLYCNFETGKIDIIPPSDSYNHLSQEVNKRPIGLSSNGKITDQYLEAEKRYAQSDWKSASEIYRNALEEYQKLDYFPGIIQSKHELANTLFMLGENITAQRMYQEVLESVDSQNNTIEAIVRQNRAYLSLYQGNFQAAENELNEVLQLSSGFNSDTQILFLILRSLVRYEQKYPQDAWKECEAAQKILIQTATIPVEIKGDLSVCFGLLSIVKGNAQEALEFLERGIESYHRLPEHEMQKKALFDVSKIEKEIENLKNDLANQVLNSSNNQSIWMLFGGIGFTGAGAGLVLFGILRNVHRNEKFQKTKELQLPTYQTFDLLITGASQGQLRVRVLPSAGGGDATELTLQPAYQTTHIETGAVTNLRQMGEEIGNALFPGRVSQRFVERLHIPHDQPVGVRIRLHIDEESIAQIPWEAACFNEDYLSLRLRTSLVRYVSTDDPPPALTVTGALRVLGIVSTPLDLASLNVAQEQQAFEQALQPLIDAGKVSLAWLAQADKQLLQDNIRQWKPHIIHFVGHGDYDESRREGDLFFTDNVGNAVQTSASELAIHLRDSTVRFVFLNACKSGRTSGGLAETLVRKGIAAALGMQTAVRDDVAIAFATSFYRALSDGWPVDAALVEGRKAIVNLIGLERPDWVQPVLYVRAPDGQLFRNAE